MKVVAVIPVKGRLPLLKYTIKRLLEKNGVDQVVCVADTIEEFNVIKENGAHVVEHDNQPLGKKWNAGFEYAQTLNPDAILFVGSSDWISDDWVPQLAPFMKEYDLIGVAGFTMMDIGLKNGKTDLIRMCHWEGYGPGNREDEPIGIGRMVSARILNKIGWRPFDDNRNNSMDFMMFNKVNNADGKIGMVKSDELVALSVSTNAWLNMHKFEDHWNNKVPFESHRIKDMKRYFKMFPEYKEIFQSTDGKSETTRDFKGVQ